MRAVGRQAHTSRVVVGATQQGVTARETLLAPDAPAVRHGRQPRGLLSSAARHAAAGRQQPAQAQGACAMAPPPRRCVAQHRRRPWQRPTAGSRAVLRATVHSAPVAAPRDCGQPLCHQRRVVAVAAPCVSGTPASVRCGTSLLVRTLRFCRARRRKEPRSLRTSARKEEGRRKRGGVRRHRAIHCCWLAACPQSSSVRAAAQPSASAWEALGAVLRARGHHRTRRHLAFAQARPRTQLHATPNNGALHLHAVLDNHVYAAGNQTVRECMQERTLRAGQAHRRAPRS